MKRLLLGLVVILCITGCSKKKPAPNDVEKEDAIAEFAAGILIDHAFSNEDHFAYNVNRVPSKPTEQATENATESTTENSTEASTESSTQAGTDKNENTTTAATEEKPSKEDSTEPVSGDIATFLGLKGFSGTINNVIATKNYSNNNIFEVTAPNGQIFIVVEFTLTNNSGEDKSITTANAVHKIYVSNKKYNIFNTGLLNDITVLNKKEIKAGESFDAFMAFAIGDGEQNGTIAIESASKVRIELKLD